MKATMSKRRSVLLAAAVVVSTTWAGAALATPGLSAVGTVMARAGFVDSVDITFKIADERGTHVTWARGLTRDPVDRGDFQSRFGSFGTEVIRVRRARETVMQQITIAPGGHTGWHSHPGPVVVLVKAGELTVYSSDDPTCGGRTYVAGESFIDHGQGHVHIARNLGAVQAVDLWVTYFDVPIGQPFRIDAPDPGTCQF
jgi:quercetin dioxygenase-like cupin family protein